MNLDSIVVLIFQFGFINYLQNNHHRIQKITKFTNSKYSNKFTSLLFFLIIVIKNKIHPIQVSKYFYPLKRNNYYNITQN